MDSNVPGETFKDIPFESILKEPVRNGLTKPSRFRGSGVKMISMGELFENDIIEDIEMNRVPVTEAELESSNICKADLLFARQSLVLAGAGKCSYIERVTEPTVFESHLIRARIDKTKAIPKYVYYYFCSPRGKGEIRSIVEQVSAAGIRGKDLIKLHVLLPAYNIQQNIVSVLSNIDEKIHLNTMTNDYLAA